jgi:hypothetical protein
MQLDEKRAPVFPLPPQTWHLPVPPHRPHFDTVSPRCSSEPLPLQTRACPLARQLLPVHLQSPLLGWVEVRERLKIPAFESASWTLRNHC